MAYITRAQWGAKYAVGKNHVDIAKRSGLILHYSTGQELGRDDCSAWVRSIEQFHVKGRGWEGGIGYNELVCRHGDVFEGRGRDAVGAHCPGQNTLAIGICYLGNDDPGTDDVTQAARAAIRERWKAHEKAAGHPLRLGAHREFKATLCPGDELYAWVRAGAPLNESSSISPQEELVRVADAVDAVRTPEGGVLVLGRNGGVYAFRNATFHGSYLNLQSRDRQGERQFVSIELNDRGGYDILADDGALYSFPL